MSSMGPSKEDSRACGVPAADLNPSSVRRCGWNLNGRIHEGRRSDHFVRGWLPADDMEANVRARLALPGRQTIGLRR